jgi:hypothetical protein
VTSQGWTVMREQLAPRVGWGETGERRQWHPVWQGRRAAHMAALLRGKGFAAGSDGVARGAASGYLLSRAATCSRQTYSPFAYQRLIEREGVSEP